MLLCSIWTEFRVIPTFCSALNEAWCRFRGASLNLGFSDSIHDLNDQFPNVCRQASRNSMFYLNKSNFSHVHDLNCFRDLWGMLGRAHLQARLLNWRSTQAQTPWPRKWPALNSRSNWRLLRLLVNATLRARNDGLVFVAREVVRLVQKFTRHVNIVVLDIHNLHTFVQCQVLPKTLRPRVLG